MATTIKSSALDFNNIKNNLKTYFQSQPEFADYNFEASGLSNILDVLAYNTHLNALTANFALNESFLGTAQLRSSMVSHSEAIGYIPDSRTAAVATINLSITYTGVNRPQKLELVAGQTFLAAVDDRSYVFQTLEDITATDNGAGLYRFKTINDSYNIDIYEGVSKSKRFMVGQYEDNVVYVIPDKYLDLDTCRVKVFPSPTSNVYDTYTNISEAVSVSEVSSLYLMKESPNGYFELSFGNGTALGKIPVAGNMIQVDYLSCSGPLANGAASFTTEIELDGIPETDYNVNAVITVNNSAGGSYKESIESIRKNAPYLYASQNRMVTASDYSSLVLRHYSSLISDIAAWGGQDNVKREFGKIFMSILFNDDLGEGTIASTKDKIRQLANQLSVLSFTLEFADPLVTYIETGIDFDFNSALTDLPLGTMQTFVKNAAVKYFQDNLGKFGQTFRLSNLLTDIDEVSSSVLSSSASIKMQQRIVPVLSVNNNLTIRYPVAIKNPDDEFYVVTSSNFIYEGKVAKLRNRLTTSTLEVVDVANSEILVDNVGNYEPSSGKLNLVAFMPDNTLGGVNYIKISAIPANVNSITPVNNNVLLQDVDASYAIGNIVYAS